MTTSYNQPQIKQQDMKSPKKSANILNKILPVSYLEGCNVPVN